MSELFIGLDLGGTNVKAGIVNCNGKLLAKTSLPTGHGSEAVINNMIIAARSAAASAGVNMDAINAIGIASPGPLSSRTGVVFNPANLPGWKDVPLRDRISTGLGRPAVLENDANAAAFGEFWAGTGRTRHIRNMVMLTLGTGIGGGVINEGQLVRGSHDFAAEIGHTIVFPGGELCGCGQRGCLEAYASARNIGRHAGKLLRKDSRHSSLRKLASGIDSITAREVEDHARAGDEVALEIWNQACLYLAIACVNCVHWVDPELIVLAGGLIGANAFLLDRVRQYFLESYWSLLPPGVEIALAELGNDAGIIGAAGVAIQSVNPVVDRQPSTSADH